MGFEIILHYPLAAECSAQAITDFLQVHHSLARMATSSELALSYAVDRRLGVGHGMYDGVANTVFPLDI